MTKTTIASQTLKQIAIILLILILAGVLLYHLSGFISSFLGAVSIYVIVRRFHLYLITKKKWKIWVSSLFLVLLSFLVLAMPLYAVVQLFINQIENPQIYIAELNIFFDKIHLYLLDKLEIDLLSKDNLNKFKTLVTEYSTAVLSEGLNILSLTFITFFLLYFMLSSYKSFELYLEMLLPLKRTNAKKIRNKLNKMITANVIGIPVVAIGQGVVAFIGYLIFGAPNPMTLLAMSCITAMIPIVGASIVYLPVGLFMMANGNTFNGAGVIIYGVTVVAMVDNILRFTLLKKLDDIHPLNTVFGIFVGMKLFGFLGLIFGPILFSFLTLLLQIYKDEYTDEDQKDLII